MKTIFHEGTTTELINRIDALKENAPSQWGKMNAYQMVKHCRLWEEMMQSKTNLKRAFIGRIFGRMALKSVLGNTNPLKRSTPTIPSLMIKESAGDFEAEKKRWISAIEQYANFNNDNFQHVFFGKMTKEQIGQMVYKHIDHHLTQFNA
jgi:Protein of unknown function (DUF1569)